MAWLFLRCLKQFLLNFYLVKKKKKLNSSSLKIISGGKKKSYLASIPQCSSIQLFSKRLKKKPSKNIIMLKVDKELGSRI